MASAFILASGGITYAASANKFIMPVGYFITNQATEANAQVTWRTAGNLKNSAVHISSNATTVDSTVNARKNTANLTQTITVTHAVIGMFEDTTHTDAIIATDKLCSNIIVGAGGTLGVNSAGFLFDATTNTVTKLGHSQATLMTGASTTYFLPLDGFSNVTNTTEANAKCRQRKAGTLTNLFTNVSANSRTASTVSSRLTGAAGALTATVTASTPGIYEDTTHSDTLAVASDSCFKWLNGTGALAITIESVAADFTSTLTQSQMVCADPVVVNQGAAPRYLPLSGGNVPSATESFDQFKARAAFVMAEITMLITVSTATVSTGGAFLDQNTTPSALTANPPSSTTGVFSDSTHTVTVATTDLLSTRLTWSAGAWTIPVISMWGSIASVLTTIGKTETTTISEVILRKPIPKIATETKTISEVLLRKPVPKIPTETKTISETQLRKPVPKLATQTTTISESIKFPFWKRALSETKTIAETLLRKPIPKITTETKTITETQLRKPIPKIVAETKTIAEALAVKMKFLRAFTETKTIVEVQLRKPIPRLATQTTSISETKLRKPIPSIATQSTTISETLKRSKVGRVISETVSIAETQLRKVIRKISLQSTSISETQLRKAIPKIVTQTITISDSKLRKVMPKIAIEVNTISDTLVAIWKFLYSITETTTITSSMLRKVKPKVATEVKTVSETLLRNVKPRIATEVKTITEILLRKVIPNIATQVTAISDALLAILGGHTTFTLTETIAISDSVLRETIRQISEAATITETQLRKVIPVITAEVKAISESLTFHHIFPRAITQTIVISESFLRTIPESFLDLVIIVESLNKAATHFITIATQTVSISDSKLRTVIPYILDMTVISDSFDKLCHFFRTITETKTITDTRLRLVIPHINTEVKSISSSIRRSISPVISIESVSIADSLARIAMFFRPIHETITVIDRVFGWLVGRIRRVVKIGACN